VLRAFIFLIAQSTVFEFAKRSTQEQQRSHLLTSPRRRQKQSVPSPTNPVEHFDFDMPDEVIFDSDILQFSYNALKFLFAVSPLFLLAFVVYSGFADPEEEEVRRRKKHDFQLEGHSE